MADKTRIRVSNNVTFYHRMEVSGDAPEHDVATTEANASGIGCSADFQYTADATITATKAGEVVNAVTGTIGTGGTTLDGFYIKNSGYTSADKDVAIATTTYVGLNVGTVTAANRIISLYPGQGVWINKPGTSMDSVVNWSAMTSTGDVYLEVWTVKT